VGSEEGGEGVVKVAVHVLRVAELAGRQHGRAVLEIE
jgi:hypothetical protein